MWNINERIKKKKKKTSRKNAANDDDDDDDDNVNIQTYNKHRADGSTTNEPSKERKKRNWMKKNSQKLWLIVSTKLKHKMKQMNRWTTK